MQQHLERCKKNSHTDPIYDHVDNMSRGANVQASSGARDASLTILSASPMGPRIR